MNIDADAIAWIIRAAAAAPLIATLIPLIPSGQWWIRIFDFPRIHFAVAAAVIAPLTLIHATPLDLILGAALLAALIWQITRIAPYTPLAPVTVEHHDHAELAVLVVNLDVRNDRHDDMRDMIRNQNADVVVLLELSETWSNALDPLRDDYPSRTEDVRPDGLGIALWARRELIDPEVRTLVSERRPSIHARLKRDDGDDIRIVALHPTPPALPKPRDDGRYDARIRDAELILVAREVAEHPDDPWIVAGDFNDVAWSRTTRMFKHISGLLDPRIGRGLYTTYHARRPLLRYPLDHVFISPGFKTARLQRRTAPGSDHFAIQLDAALPYVEQNETNPAPEEKKEAQQAVQEGRQDAKQNGETPHPQTT